MAKMLTQTYHDVAVHVHCHPCHNVTDYITRPVLYLPLDLPQKTARLLAALATLRRNNKQFGQDQTSTHHFPISLYQTSKAYAFLRLKFLQHKKELRKGLSFSSTYNFTFLAATYRPPLWSSGQSFWLQIQRSRVRFPALPDFSEQ